MLPADPEPVWQIGIRRHRLGAEHWANAGDRVKPGPPQEATQMKLSRWALIFLVIFALVFLLVPYGPRPSSR